ncbi:uncharacterized protein N7482_001166 [Penicillium canariense]|uniref:DUF924 domain-containing protein n=1 Tax=Penicillium canariense TaxID=189055 RepID=A0A9W9IFJ0_9EURO|nr:uncharacterized protein N7482_001166 [Penicillium canariense]KAJ5175289.1 hypothetical protein N7482_001166 [Penicillium canariense]
MISDPSELNETLTADLLDEVREFWFEYFEDEDALILPGQRELDRWFIRDDDFDKICVAQFQHALETIIESGASAADILNAIDTSSPLEWISIIILLDQVPRNCYRGDESKVVFEQFDPLAEEITLRAIDAGIPTRSSEVRYRLSYRLWFHLPLMNSEKIAAHEKAVTLHEETAKDMGQFLLKNVSTLTEDEKKCYASLSLKYDALSAFLTTTFDFEKRYRVILDRFGRYPNRNKALGRVSTAEEAAYLDNGGDAFD